MKNDLLNTTATVTPLMAMTMIRPTPIERAMGRLMRAPDHDAGTEGGDAGDNGAAGGEGDEGSEGADDSGKGGEGEGGEGADATTLMNKAAEGDDAGEGGDDDKAAEGEGEKGEKGDKGDPDPEDVVPEKYEFEAVDGLELDDKLLADTTPILKEAGVTAKQAKQLAPVAKKLYDRFAEQQGEVFADMRADWAKEAMADPELGGQNWKKTEANVAKALDYFVGPKVTKNDKGEDVPNQFRQLLDETGFGNHPEMIRAWAKIGALVAEDGTFARGSGAAAPTLSREEVLYPNDAPKKK
jgi:hypothetical protein